MRKLMANSLHLPVLVRGPPKRYGKLTITYAASASASASASAWLAHQLMLIDFMHACLSLAYK